MNKFNLLTIVFMIIFVGMSLTTMVSAEPTTEQTLLSTSWNEHTQQANDWQEFATFAERAISFQAFMPDYDVVIHDILFKEDSLTILWSVSEVNNEPRYDSDITEDTLLSSEWNEHTQQANDWQEFATFAERAISFQAFMPDYDVVIHDILFKEDSLTILWSVSNSR